MPENETELEPYLKFFIDNMKRDVDKLSASINDLAEKDITEISEEELINMSELFAHCTVDFEVMKTNGIIPITDELYGAMQMAYITEMLNKSEMAKKKKEEPIRRLSNNPQPKPVRQQYEPTPVVHVAPVQHVASKDYDALAEDLLESDPFLKPGQAAFYVRHCTVGKFYTIAQYQKATGCVYETARTSMDNLAKRGYYKRENLKNKFIYTPIPKE